MSLSCINIVKRRRGQTSDNNTDITLSCLSHVKRNGESERPAPPSHIDVAFVGDRSGSMCSMGQSAKKGTRAFLEDQMEMAKSGSTIHAEINTFDDKATTVYSDNVAKITKKDLNEVEIAMEPRGCTRLYDSILEAIARQKDRIRQKEASFSRLERNLGVRVLAYLAVMTDGYDNASVHTKHDVNKAISEFRKMGGVATFLAAEQDAVEVGGDMGFAQDTCLQMSSNPQHAAAALRSVSYSLKRYTTTGSTRDAEFSQMERQVSCDPHDAVMYGNPPTMDSDDDLDDLSDDDIFASHYNNVPPNLRAVMRGGLRQPALTTPPPITRATPGRLNFSGI